MYEFAFGIDLSKGHCDAGFTSTAFLPKPSFLPSFNLSEHYCSWVDFLLGASLQKYAGRQTKSLDYCVVCFSNL